MAALSANGRYLRTAAIGVSMPIDRVATLKPQMTTTSTCADAGPPLRPQTAPVARLNRGGEGAASGALRFCVLSSRDASAFTPPNPSHADRRPDRRPARNCASGCWLRHVGQTVRAFLGRPNAVPSQWMTIRYSALCAATAQPGEATRPKSSPFSTISARASNTLGARKRRTMRPCEH